MSYSSGSTLTPIQARLYRVRKTICNMLRKRGYIVADEIANMTPERFASEFPEGSSRTSLTLLVGHRDDPEEKMLVYFPDGDVGVPQCKELSTRMHESNARRGILIVSGKFSNFAKTSLMEMAPAQLVEHFLESDLIVDITEHELVPEHHVLTPEEKTALLSQYGLLESQLPNMQYSDPIARYYGLSRGQVVKIIRPSETAGRYVTYRIVV